MKIKGNSKISVAVLPALFIAVLAVSAALRTFQVFALIDASTGFYKEKSIVTVILYAVILISCLAFCIVSYISSNSAGIVTYEIESKKLSVVTYIFAFVFFIDFINSIMQSMVENAQSGYRGLELFKELLSSGTLPDFIRGVFAFLSGIYVFLLASATKNASDKASKHKLLALAPIGWSAFRLVGLFVSKISFLQVSDLFLEIAMLSFMILFFMALAQRTSGVYSDGAGWKIPAYGLCSALFAGMLSISRLIATFVNRNLYISDEHSFEIADFFFFVFAIMFVYEVTREYNLLFDED